MLVPLPLQCSTLSQLQQYIYETVCQREELVVGAFPIHRRVLRRGAAPCGILFSIQGPRQVVFTAVWEADSNRIFFYGATGERFETVRLASAPRMDDLAA